MIGFVTPQRSVIHTAVWAALAVVTGVLVAWLPVPVGGALVILTGLVLAVLVEPTLGLVIMLAVAPLKTLIATEAPLALPFDLGQAALGLVVVAWLLWRATQRQHAPLPRTRLYVPLVVIMAGFAPSLFAAASVSGWLLEIIKWLDMLLLVALVVDLADSTRLSWIAFGLILAAVLQALIGLYEFMGGSGAPHLWIMGFTHFRAFGTFGQPNPFSAFMGLTLPLALGLGWGWCWESVARWQARRRTPSARCGDHWGTAAFVAAFYGGASVLLLAGLLVSWGRGAWLGFGTAAGMMVCFAPRRRWQGFLLAGLGGLLIMSLWIGGLVPLSIQLRIDNALDEFVGFRDVRGAPVNNDNFAIIERLAHWQAAFYMASDHPWIGVGAGNYEVVYADYALPSWPRALGHAHNDYLTILAETGLVGLVGYLIGWALIVYWTVRALAVTDRVLHGLVLGLLGTWTHLAVHSLVDKLYVNNLFLHIGVMVGLLAVVSHRYRVLAESQDL